MRNLNLTDVTTTIGMPLKSGSLKHIQLAYKEALDALAKGVLGVYYDSSKAYVLFGCYNSGTGSNYTISEGAIYYQGEIYLVDAVSFSTSGSNVPICTITTTYYTSTDADTVEFTDSISRSVHEIKKIVISSGVSGSGTVNYSSLIFQNQGAGNKSILASDYSNAIGSATYTGGSIQYVKRGGVVVMNIAMIVTPSTYDTGNQLVFNLDVKNYIPYPVAYAGFSFGTAPCGYLGLTYRLQVSATSYKSADGYLLLQSGVNTPFIQVILHDTTTSAIVITGQMVFVTNQ